MRTISVQVEKKHFENALPGDCLRSPVLFALKDATPGENWFYYDYGNVRHYPAKGGINFIRLPKELRAAGMAYDILLKTDPMPNPVEIRIPETDADITLLESEKGEIVEQ